MTKPTDPYIGALAALTFSLVVLLGPAKHSFAETPPHCDERIDFNYEIARIFTSDPKVVAKCDIFSGGSIHYVDLFAPSKTSGTVYDSRSVIFADKLDVVDGIVYLRNYVPKPLDCGAIEDLPSHVLIENMTCHFRSQVKK